MSSLSGESTQSASPETILITQQGHGLGNLLASQTPTTTGIVTLRSGKSYKKQTEETTLQLSKPKKFVAKKRNLRIYIEIKRGGLVHLKVSLVVKISKKACTSTNTVLKWLKN